MADVGWNYPFLVYLIGLPIIVSCILSVREPAKREPEIDVRVTHPQRENLRGRIMFCYVMVFLEMFLMFSLPTNFSYYVTDDVGLDYSVCGVLLGLMGGCQALFSLLYSRSTRKISDLSAYTVSFLLMAIALSMLYIPEALVTIISMIIVGFSLGLLMPTLIGQLTSYSGAANGGKIMGGYSVALNMATFASGLLVTVFVSVLGNITTTFLALGCGSAGVFVSCLAMRLGKGKKTGVAEHVEVPATQSAPAQSVEASICRSILVSTDGSEYSAYAVEKAAEIAKKNDAELTALYVFDTESYSGLIGEQNTAEGLRSMGESVSREALGFAVECGVRYGVKVFTKTVKGHPADEIVAESKNHDLVVCGSLGRTNLARALMGSVAEKVVRTAHCPVLVCRKN